MNHSETLVFTFIGADRPGLVQMLSDTVARCGGNWLESRMSTLAGQFAGIVEVAVAADRVAGLRDGLAALSAQGLTVVLAGSSIATDDIATRRLRLSIIGPDRPGIVREVSGALAAHRINVLEMDTSLTSAPMSGEPLFEAVAEIRVPKSFNLAELNSRLDEIADALTIDIDLEESLR